VTTPALRGGGGAGIPVSDEIQGNLSIRDYSGTGAYGNLLVEHNLTVLGSIISPGISSALNVVTQYGADPTGVADSSTALDTATAAAASKKVPLYIPAGTYKRTTAMNWKINGLIVLTDGAANTKIIQATHNVPVVQVAGSHQHIGGLTLGYAAQEPSTNTAATCITLGDNTVGSCFMSVFPELILQNGANGMLIDPTLTVGAGVFSCYFGTIEVYGYSISAIFLNGNNDGGTANCTGCVFDNIYTHNDAGGSPNACSSFPVGFQNWDELIVNQLNIEHCAPTSKDALALTRVGTGVFNALHFEALTLAADGLALLHLNGEGSCVIRGLTHINSTLSGSASNPIANFIGTGPYHLNVIGFHEKSNTITTPAHPFANYGSATNSQVIVEGITLSQLTANETTKNAGCLSQFGIAPGAAGLVPYTAGFTSFATGGSANLINSSSGASGPTVSGTFYYAALFIPVTVTLTGVIACTGTAGGSDSWIVALWPGAGGAALAWSALSGIAAPAANTKKAFPFTGQVTVPGPGVYIIGIQSNGTHDKILVFPNAIEGFITGVVGGTFGTVPSLTPATSYTTGEGPMVTTY
jgi:hypothetical protein